MRKWLKKIAQATAAMAMLAVAQVAHVTPAQAAYPDQTITFVCAFPAGSGADVLVRYFADKVAKVSGATIIVENKPGALSNIAAEYTARSKPDGYTIFVHSGNSIAGNMWIMKKPPINVVTDLMTIATVNKQAFMIAVAPDSPYKDMKELTAAMKEKGDGGSYAVNATSGKVLAEVYKQTAGLDTVAVQYKTAADSLNDITSGAMDWGSYDPVFALSQQRQNRLRILGVGAAERMKGAPDIPTLKEQGFDIDQLGWWGAMVAKGTPDDIVTKINGWFNTVLAEPDTVKFLADQGGDAYITTPAEAQALMAKTVDEWKEYVRIAQIPQQ
ncbi:Bug family tripartite tricarboxylate transporter substrate binding protein [Xaviernesmea oryzae]|uniref:Tripartite-type tricarboxylate transporter, receptor component TctC n=1 Tax=Xaviernesmea oryzae TaxID=464029 RepID=A0A1X7DJE1_9HYPH|nr:tripartite tricarboxylate transporter substrate binding protein [Xaviernesmea oryzae]SMF16656.1 Tripartite-type tricarboxylate transporter, receptor component TctC [Xaviernesmea oryzae]